MNELKPNDRRAKIAIVFVTLVLILDIISLLFDYLEYILLNSEFITPLEAENNDSRQLILAVLYMIIFLISGITFILWFRRAYYNLHSKVDNLEHGEGWAAGSWFVPIISLFRPFQIMKELYIKTDDFLSQTIDIDKKSDSTIYLGFWWTLWIISSFFGQFLMKSSLKAETIEELSDAAFLGMINSGIAIPLALLTIKVIYDYSQTEILLFNVKEEELPVSEETYSLEN